MERAGDIPLGSQIQKSDLQTVILQNLLFRAGHLLHHFSCGVGLQAGKHLIQRLILLCGNHSIHGAALAQNFGQRAGVNSGDSRNLIFLQETLYRILASEIAGNSGQFSYDITIRPGSL